VPVLDLFRYTTVSTLAERLRGIEQGAAEPSALAAPVASAGAAATIVATTTATATAPAAQPTSEARAERFEPPPGVAATSGRIAVVGMAARLPKARSAEEFWRNIRDGVEGVSFFTPEELREAGVSEALIENPAYVPSRGRYEGIEQFDARLFRIPPREAELIDPQQRVFLECAWEALEHAGHAPDRFPGRIGVFGGVGLNYYYQNLFSNPMATSGLSNLQIAIANDKDFLPTRVAY
jgi:hypothetical protein